MGRYNLHQYSGVRTHTKPFSAKVRRSAIISGNTIPWYAECAYHISLFYGYMGSALGISIGMLNAAMLAVLAGWCLTRFGSKVLKIYWPIVFPLACAVSFVAVQLLIHGESLADDYVRSFVPWAMTVIIMYSLTLREGFLHRFALVAFAIGLMSLPYLDFQSQGVERAAVDKSVGGSGAFANSNALAEWFGFCCVYFVIAGVESRRNLIRATSWIAAVGCLLVVVLTVSRGTLFGFALATVIAFRRLLKRGFGATLLLVILAGLAAASGMFEQSIGLYVERGMEETGRLIIWPLVIERFLDSPLTGVGVSEIETYVAGGTITPHNSFLFIGLASGVVPLMFFIAYWWRAARGVACLHFTRAPSAAFYLPMFVYVFVSTMLSNAPFVSPITVIVLSGPLWANSLRRLRLKIVRDRTGHLRARIASINVGPGIGTADPTR